MAFNQKLMQDGRPVNKTDTIVQLEGLYYIIDKKGRISNKLLYKDGYIIKDIYLDQAFWNIKKRGKYIKEITEYDCENYNPFGLFYILYKNDGSIKYNLLMRMTEVGWRSEPAFEILSGDPGKLNVK